MDAGVSKLLKNERNAPNRYLMDDKMKKYKKCYNNITNNITELHMDCKYFNTRKKENKIIYNKK